MPSGADARLFGFGADAARASRLDRRVRDGLADSLSQIADAVGSRIDFEPPRAGPVLDAIRARAVPPGIVAIYADLVVAGFAEDAAAATRLASDLVDAMGRPAGTLRVVDLEDEDLGPGQAERYRRMVCDDPDTRFPMLAAGAAERVRAGCLIAEAMALLDAAAPEIAAELRALVREIVLVDSRAPVGDTEALVFDGAVSFYVWGAVFLNGRRLTDRVGTAVAMVHETTHMLLFGMTLGAPMVANGPDERYASPLRWDRRPMDGVVHATYVLARMRDCLERLLASGALSDAERVDAEAALVRHRAEFSEGLAVVAPHARFTPEGGAAFDAMRRAIAA